MNRHEIIFSEAWRTQNSNKLVTDGCKKPEKAGFGIYGTIRPDLGRFLSKASEIGKSKSQKNLANIFRHIDKSQ